MTATNEPYEDEGGLVPEQLWQFSTRATWPNGIDRNDQPELLDPA